jgi:DNA-binding MarR family transcriptional regulator
MSEKLTSTPGRPEPPGRPGSSEPPGLPRPEANFGYLFRLAHQRFRALLESGLEDQGLSAQEYGILSVFETRPELSTAELARVSQVTRQTMHAAVRSLEAAGLIERRARNQRVVLLRLTARGRERLATATSQVRRVEHAALAGLSPADQRTVRTWLADLAAMPASPQQNGAGKDQP